MKPRALLISDVRGWAFDQNMRDLEKHLSHRFDFSHFYVAEWRRPDPIDFSGYNVVFNVHHRHHPHFVQQLPWERLVGSLRSLWFKPETEAPPDEADVALVNRHKAFHVVTRRTLEELAGRCPRAVYLTNPVDVERFPQRQPLREVVASWNGNAKHRNRRGEYIKGFEDIVRPACMAAGVHLEVAEYNTCRLPPDAMPDFYRRANVALCASLYEGASNSVMEAMAAGQALITTDVGNHLEMQRSQVDHFGDTGILVVSRNVDAFAEALRHLVAHPSRVAEMGQLNRQEIAMRWSWPVWADRYERFLRAAL